jgi:ribonucleoside-diphosphate reductase alpha chain
MTDSRTVYAYNEALISSQEYFGGDEFPAKVFLDKYALRNDKLELLESTPDEMFHRVATELARIEKKKFKKPLTYDEIMSYIKGFKKIIPQGSPLSGIGNPYQFVTISNCYVVESPPDSYAGIMKTDEEIVQISKRRGGVGTDVSHLRPNGTPTTNAARTSTGIIPFMQRYSDSIREVAQNGRRGALMLTCSIHHPEILDFAKCKRDLTKVTGANISIRLSDEFLQAVKDGTDYEMRWPVDSKKPVISEMIDARRVWMEIIENAHATAEPGLLFWDNIIRESPADCYAEFGYRTTSTNPCGELPLCPYDSCRLLLLNLYSYVKNPFTSKSYFDYDEFYADAQVAQRFMDDLIDIELEMIERIIAKIKKDPESQTVKSRELELWHRMKDACANGRRTGTGITALGDTIAALGYKYGSTKSIEVTEEIYKTLKLGAYRSSVDMAKELGHFKVWDHNLEKNNPFLLRIKEEDPRLWKDMKEYGRRNISLLTTAPAGTVSIEAQTTSGVEPVYLLMMIRRKKVNPNDEGARVDYRDETGDCWQEFTVFHPKVQEWMEVTGKTDIKESPWYGCCAEDINWTSRVKLQAAAQRHVDHSISSTVNLPEDVTVEEVSKIYQTAWEAGTKGVTVYRKNCRSGVLVEKKEVQEEMIQYHDAPKRPEELPCDVYHVSVKGHPYFVLVGTLFGEPYEIFVGDDKDKLISRSIKKGVIKKHRRGKYGLFNPLDPDNIIHPDIAKYIGDDYEGQTRLISTSLRHGVSVSFVVHQLEKIEGDMMSFNKACARVLKKYIKDGEAVSGEECPECRSQLARKDGCIQCVSCGWSKC